jgi:hypothetical protein
MCARPARGSITGMIEARELTKDYATRKLTERVQRDVFVRSPRRSGLARVLTGMGATVLAEPNGGLAVTGMDAWRIASAAAAHYIPIQELTPRSASLDDSCLELTNASIDHHVEPRRQDPPRTHRINRVLWAKSSGRRGLDDPRPGAGFDDRAVRTGAGCRTGRRMYNAWLVSWPARGESANARPRLITPYPVEGGRLPFDPVGDGTHLLS